MARGNVELSKTARASLRQRQDLSTLAVEGKKTCHVCNEDIKTMGELTHAKFNNRMMRPFHKKCIGLA